MPGHEIAGVISPAGGWGGSVSAGSATDAAPLHCAGVTTYHSLRQSAPQRAMSSRFWVLAGSAISACNSRRAWVYGRDRARPGQGKPRRSLGAHIYVDSKSEDVVAALNKLGGTRVVLSTVTSSSAISAVIDGIGVGGKLVVVGASMEAIQVAATDRREPLHPGPRRGRLDR